jgi:multidrug efflux pump subunit AcrB
MIFGAFVLLGGYALPRLQIEAMPEVDLPTLTVQTYWNGASPQAIQRSITVPIEEAARKVHGVESIESVSRAGWSQVEVSFRRGVDIEFARVDLNEQLGSASLRFCHTSRRSFEPSSSSRSASNRPSIPMNSTTWPSNGSSPESSRSMGSPTPASWVEPDR